MAGGSAWARRLREGSGRRVVCFPHAGGSAPAFAPLAAALPDPVDVVALQYPGRLERRAEPCIDSIDALVAAVVPELVGGGWLDRPFVLFGHSMGAIVAYEVARVLERSHGLVPLGLLASGRRAPSTHRSEQVHRGGDRALLREVARLGGTPQVLLDDEDVQQLMLPALRGDYKAIETYSWRPGPPLACPIEALVGAADPLTSEAEAAAWSQHTFATFAIHVFPGGHFYLADHLPAVARLVAASLA